MKDTKGKSKGAAKAASKGVAKPAFPAEDLDEHSKKICEVRVLMKDRETARKSNDFGKSDMLRDQLEDKHGVVIQDQKDGPSGWKFKDGSTKKLKAGASNIPEEASKARKKENPYEAGQEKSRDRPRGEDGEKKKKKQKKTAEADEDGPEQKRNKKAMEALIGSSPAGRGARNIQGILIEDLIVGTGKEAESGKRIKMGYVGRLKSNNKMFDASGNRPFMFRLGRSEVIRGWDIGCAGMKEGGKRRLTIPPEKAYGRGGAPPTIPGNATLVFEVTLQEVK